MDHILENEGKPVPDLSSTSTGAPSTATGGDDEDEDMKLAQSLAQGDQEAKASDMYYVSSPLSNQWSSQSNVQSVARYFVILQWPNFSELNPVNRQPD
jgi:hypothetical protein